MANKRIRKKWAKADLLRDKRRVIVCIMAMLDSDQPRYEQIKIAKMLWKMSLEEILALSEKAIRIYVRSYSPLLQMIPRDIQAGDMVNWHAVVSDFSERG